MKTKITLAVIGGLIVASINSTYGLELTNVAKYMSGYTLTDVAIGDLNNDGLEDLVVPDNSAYEIYLLKGQSDGTFTSWGDITVGDYPISVVIDDFNNDSNLDIAVPVEISGTYFVKFLYGDGSGNFTSQDISVSTLAYYNTISGDFNNDGKKDIAFPSYNNKSFTILFNNGNGAFSESVYSLSGDYYPLFIASADVNNDSYLDLLVGIENDAGSDFVAVWLNNGSGVFTQTTTLNIAGSPWGIDTGDFNNDGNVDFAVVSYNNDSFGVFLGNGDGTFGSPVNYSTGDGPTAIVAADLDGDNKLDIVVANYDDFTIQTFKGNGDGTFSLVDSYNTSDSPWMVKSSDFNNDGFKDIVVSGGDGIDIFLSISAVPLVSYSTNYVILEDNSVTVEMNVTGTTPYFKIVNLPANGALSNFITNSTKLIATYTPAQDYYGSDQIKFIATNTISTTAVATVSITILPVNDRPSFNILSNTINVLEDSLTVNILNFAYNISKGAVNERSQPVRFSVTNNNNNLFSIQPNISLTGRLSFKPAPNANGSAQVTAYLIDGGGTANGGQDVSMPVVFTINVINVNDPPVLKSLDRYFVSRNSYEDTDVVYNFGVTDLETDPSNLILTVTSTNQNLAPNQNIQITGSGTNRTVTISPIEDEFGTTLLTFTLSDGTNSVSKTSLLRISAVNDQPYFELLTDTVMWDSNLGRCIQPVVDYDRISTGPANESRQSWAFYITSNSNPGLFASLPVVDKFGVLYFTPRKGVTGTATIGIKIVDNGGVIYGGNNTYGPLYFDIVVQ